MSTVHPSLGKYKVIEEIGRGGMGAVYKGHDPVLDRTVAIKLLAPHLVWEKDFVERFLREARGAARLRHPNIIEIHDVGQDGVNYYFVMTYLPGPSLKDLIIQKKRLTPAEALPILHQLADALDYAHSKGLVHRDVKPANVMFDERGQAVLMDFGIVKAAQESKLTATGASIGTPHYMAPEQVQGTGVDARTDEYALGIIAFEMLTGRVPFDGDTTTAILFKQVHEPPPSVTACCPDLPPALEAVLHRVMIKSPAERYASCQEFVEALEQALGQPTQPVTVPQPVLPPIAVTQPFKTPAEPKPQPAPRPVVPPLLLAGAGIVALALVVLIAIAVSRSGGGTQANTPTAIAAIQPTSVPAKTVIPLATLTPTPTNTLAASATPTQQPTNTPQPPTNTPRPTGTSLPGVVVVPIEKMARSIPWLPLVKDAEPGIEYYAFNVNMKPFDNRLVRQAFAAAVDRRAIADLASKSDGKNRQPATTFTPPETLGRNLYGQVGLPFNPTNARSLLAKAGYPNGQGFPVVTLSTNKSGAHEAIANTIVAMWRENLNVNVKAEVVDNWQAYLDLLGRDAPAIYRLGWVADYNDPDNFLKGVFHSRSENNRGHFSDGEFDRLVEQAAASSDPAVRQALYIQAEHILCEYQAAVIPLYSYGTQSQ